MPRGRPQAATVSTGFPSGVSTEMVSLFSLETNTRPVPAARAIPDRTATTSSAADSARTTVMPPIPTCVVQSVVYHRSGRMSA
ncbi:hypothetical protein HRbin39_00700 [bacterium HR39]|nr:hypothetical protein HRbin39_00700 [bacterium HR39]